MATGGFGGAARRPGRAAAGQERESGEDGSFFHSSSLDLFGGSLSARLLQKDRGSPLNNLQEGS